MRDGPSPRILCLTPFASSFSSPTAASARGVRSTSSDAAPSPSANVDRRLMLAIIGLLLSGPHDLGAGCTPRVDPGYYSADLQAIGMPTPSAPPRAGSHRSEELLACQQGFICLKNCRILL